MNRLGLRLGLGLSNTISPGGGGGGEGAPEWVPVGASWHVDFLGVRAWDGAEVGIETLMGSDPNLAVGWGTAGEYDPTFLTADGYSGDPDLFRSIKLGLIGAARALTVAGSTIRLKWKQPHAEFSFSPLVILNSDGSVLLENDTLVPTNEFYAAPRDVAEIEYDGVVGGAGLSNSMVITCVSNKVSLSINGGATQTIALTTDDWPPPGPTAFVAAILDFGANLDFPLDESIAVQSVTGWAPLEDADLPALSALS